MRVIHSASIARIETHYTEKITLADLAEKSHLSQRHFTRVFQECIGRSPIDHLMHVRVQKAAEQLKHTDRTITDIAFDCGFSSSQYFATVFRKHFKHTPREHRKELKNTERILANLVEMNSNSHQCESICRPTGHSECSEFRGSEFRRKPRICAVYRQSVQAKRD